MRRSGVLVVLVLIVPVLALGIGYLAFRDQLQKQAVAPEPPLTLVVDDGLDATVDAAWLNGGLETDLPFMVQGRMGRRSAQGTLGDGGPTLSLRTVNGSIRIY